MNVIFDNGTHRIESAGTIYVDTRTAYSTQAPSVTVNGSPAGQLAWDYVAAVGDTIVITTTLIDGSAITYPGVTLKMPIVRHADNAPTDDEIYFDATIIDGSMTATGSLPRSGDWKCMTSRINKALERMGADWKLSAPDITIIA